MRRIVIALFVLASAVIGATPQAGLAQSRPGVHDRQAARGQTVPIFRIRYYQADRGCTPRAAPMVDVSPHPKLGQITSAAGLIRGDGPCGVMEYPTVTVFFTAGRTAGVEEFEVFFFDNYGGSPPDSYKVRMIVR